MQPKPPLVSADTLRACIVAQTGAYAELADVGYYLVDAQWVNGKFASSYYDFLALFKLLDWKPERNDCDKFANWSLAVAQALHARSTEELGLAPGGLAWGIWNYKPDWSESAHRINWFAYPVAISEEFPEGIAIGHFEPNGRKRHIVQLSDAEIISCFKCAN